MQTRCTNSHSKIHFFPTRCFQSKKSDKKSIKTDKLVFMGERGMRLGKPCSTILNDYPLFSLTKEAQRKKLSKKESAERVVSLSAESDQRCARWMCGRFLSKKRRKSFPAASPLSVANTPTNQNLKLLFVNFLLSVF